MKSASLYKYNPRKRKWRKHWHYCKTTKRCSSVFRVLLVEDQTRTRRFSLKAYRMWSQNYGKFLSSIVFLDADYLTDQHSGLLVDVAASFFTLLMSIWNGPKAQLRPSCRKFTKSINWNALIKRLFNKGCQS